MSQDANDRVARLRERAMAVEAALRGRCCFLFTNEKELQAGIATFLTEAGVVFRPEATIGPGECVDFLVDRLGVEVKVRGSYASVLRQLSRYLLLDAIDGVLLITTSLRMARDMPTQLHGKPILRYWIGGF